MGYSASGSLAMKIGIHFRRSLRIQADRNHHSYKNAGPIAKRPTRALWSNMAAWPESLLIESAGNLRIGIVVQEVVNEGDHLSFGHTYAQSFLLQFLME